MVELAVVLVVIALVVGGLLLGRDLLDAARIRSQVSQVESYSAALAAFTSKYAMLPGDLAATDAAALGFVTRSGEAGHGDGNGVIQSCESSCAGFCMILPLGCEVVLFWSDLANAQMVDGSFVSAADDYVQATSFADTLGYFPEAKVGGVTLHPATCARDELWLVAIRIKASSLTGVGGSVSQSPNVRASDAYRIDAKLDDGLAGSGRVRVNSVGGSNNEGYYCDAVAGPTSCVDSAGNYTATDAGKCQLNLRTATH